MKIFPIGTSRLHEPLSLFNQELINYPEMGYFHSSSQVLNIIQIAIGEMCIGLDVSKLFFRKDQTKNNQFNKNLWTFELKNSIKNINLKFTQSDLLLIEICSPRSYLFDGINIQGNPNFYQDVSYADTWKNGYYARYMPELAVTVYDDTEYILSNLARIEEIAKIYFKKIILMGHLIDPKNPNEQRLRNNDSLKVASTRLGSKSIKFYDQSYLVNQYGFRTLTDGGTDIHHLPWVALEQQAKDIQKICDYF